MGSCGGFGEQVSFAYQVQNCTKEIFMATKQLISRATKIRFHGNKYFHGNKKMSMAHFFPLQLKLSHAKKLHIIYCRNELLGCRKKMFPWQQKISMTKINFHDNGKKKLATYPSALGVRFLASSLRSSGSLNISDCPPRISGTTRESELYSAAMSSSLMVGTTWNDDQVIILGVIASRFMHYREYT
jgi:hypothetical protein